MSVQLGKIVSVRIGRGGYQDAQLGVSFALGGDGWGVGDFWGHWATRSASAEWTAESRIVVLGEIFDRLGKLISEAKVEHAQELIGRPIEATFDSPIGRLVSWRILKEVL
jgi:hypothetical protein